MPGYDLLQATQGGGPTHCNTTTRGKSIGGTSLQLHYHHITSTDTNLDLILKQNRLTGISDHLVPH
jgi:hypothetical protein